MHKIQGVEIFAVGTWNGDTYTETDLDHMIAAFSKLGYRPPLTPGHLKDSNGIPALGYIERLYRDGKKLVADFVDLPVSVFNAIKQRLFDTVSAEIYFDLERNGEKYPRALKSVALLGADIPAVDLKPLHETVFQFAAMKEYSFGVLRFSNSEDKTMDEKEIKKMQDDNAALQAQVKELSQKASAAVSKDEFEKIQKELTESNAQIKKLAEQNKKIECEKKAALIKIPALRPALQALYEAADASTKLVKFTADGKESDHSAVMLIDGMVAHINKLADQYLTPETLATEKGQFDNAGQEIDALTKKHMAEKGVKDYAEAMNAVFILRPDLKQAYAQTAQ